MPGDKASRVVQHHKSYRFLPIGCSKLEICFTLEGSIGAVCGCSVWMQCVDAVCERSVWMQCVALDKL